MTDGYWYHGNGKIGGEFYPTKPNDKERYGEYVKVKHGRWILEKVYEDEYGNGRFHYLCSECGVPAYEFSQQYCHRCGARMDGGKNDTE